MSACLFGFAAVSSRAASVTYDFTYSGKGTYDTSETVTGSGAFTATYTPGSTTGTLTSFSFTDTFSSGTYGFSTFTYSSASGTVTFSPTSPYSLVTASLSTPYVAGTNSAFGSVDFSLADSAGTIADSTGGSNAAAASFLADFSTGNGPVTLVPTTPEPATASLFALAVLIAAILCRTRQARLRAESVRIQP